MRLRLCSIAGEEAKEVFKTSTLLKVPDPVNLRCVRCSCGLDVVCGVAGARLTCVEHVYMYVSSHTLLPHRRIHYGALLQHDCNCSEGTNLHRGGDHSCHSLPIGACDK